MNYGCGVGERVEETHKEEMIYKCIHAGKANDVIMVYNSNGSNSSRYMVVKSLAVWFKRLFLVGVGCCHLPLLSAACVLG